MAEQTDVLVVGAGPAGLAAACAASSCGLDVTLVDEQHTPGGQLFRNIESKLGQSMLDPKERELGISLAREFRDAGIKYEPHTIVWGIEPRKISCTTAGKSRVLHASSIIVAPGAMERPVPFPGWTMPGVLGAGGADILRRSGGTLTDAPKGPVVLAGNGPLLLLLACHLVECGVHIVAWLDTGYWSRRSMAPALMPASLLDAPYLGKGLSLAMRIAKAKIPFVAGATNIRAIGDRQLEKVVYEVRGTQKEIVTQCLVRHEGIIPRTHILNSLGVKHTWDSLQRYWYPDVTDFGATSIEGIHLAGDAGYVHGGDASIIKGRLAGIDVAKRLGVITESEAAYRARYLQRKLLQTRIARGFLRYVFAPNPDIFDPPDETLVCRCESVTAGEIRKVVAEGHSDVNEVKRHTRCGMGLCQGRMCGQALAELTASGHSSTPKTVGTLQVRQPFRPVTMANYCTLYAPDTQK